MPLKSRVFHQALCFAPPARADCRVSSRVMLASLCSPRFLDEGNDMRDDHVLLDLLGDDVFRIERP
jgi:hypothetical protein